MFANTKYIKLSALLLMAVMIFTFSACGSSTSESNSQTQAATSAETKAENSQNETTANTEESVTKPVTEAVAESESNNAKTLVVYFSATGTTKGVAEQIASLTSADTYEILAAQPYTTEDLNWNDKNSRTTKEQNDKSVRPEIGSDKVPLDGYSTVFIGYPIWWGEEPRIMDTFVEGYDFSGKTVIPFCTSGGSGIGSSGSNLETNAGSGKWLEGERLSSSSDIEGWINGLGLNIGNNG